MRKMVMDSYEIIKFMAYCSEREEVSDGEMAYDDNEDVGRQGKKDEHDTTPRRTCSATMLCF
jgi:hypothetical protein